MNAYGLVYDRRIAAPRWGLPFLRGPAIVVPLEDIAPDIAGAALLSGGREIAALSLVRRGGRSGELVLTPAAPPHGRLRFSIVVRYTDGIQLVDDKVDGQVLAASELAIRFTEHGTVRVDLPVPLAVTPALLDPTGYRLVAVEGPPVRIRSVGRELRRPDAGGQVRRVDDPSYLELFVAPSPSGTYRLEVPALRTRDGATFGPASSTFQARLVKRGFGERTLGPRTAHAHELAPGVVLSALFAEDERAAGRGGRDE